MNRSVPSRRPGRVMLGAVGLMLLFGLGYRISLRRLRATPAEISAR